MLPLGLIPRLLKLPSIRSYHYVYYSKPRCILFPSILPVFLIDSNFVDINSLLEPSLSVSELNVISAHLSLPHSPILGKSPVLKPIGPPPLSSLIVPFIPELDGNLIYFLSAKLRRQKSYSIYYASAADSIDLAAEIQPPQGETEPVTHLVVCKSKQFLP